MATFIEGTVLNGGIKDFYIDVPNKDMFAELSLNEVYIYESLLSPTVQISVTINDTIHMLKNYLQYKMNKKGEMPNVQLNVYNNFFDIDHSDKPQGGTSKAELPLNNFRVFRMDSRKPINYHIEQYTIHMCSPSIVNNLMYRMSGFYKNTELSKVVKEAMDSAGIKEYARYIEKTDTKRDYMSNNQHPFQVIAEIADMAYKKNNYTQFLHYMTTEEVQGKHYFVSLQHLLKRLKDKHTKVDFTFTYSEKGLNETFYMNDIMTYEFPCDFDTLLDLSGGIVPAKKDYKDHKPSMMSINPFDGGIFLVDGKFHGDANRKGMGGALHTGAWSNLNNFESVGSVQSIPIIGGTSLIGKPDRESKVEHYLHKRTEPISLLHREKIDLKMVVPFNPTLHVGNLIEANFTSKRAPRSENLDFGSGVYLIAHMTHNIKVGDYSTTTLECIRVKDTASNYREYRPKHQILNELVKK